MSISIFDLFSIGIGPSSSHTVGPMLAAKEFLLGLQEKKLLPQVATIKIELYGSLALTGKGHGTDVAMLNGLIGEDPETVHPDKMRPQVQTIHESQKISLLGKHSIPFIEKNHLLFHQKEVLPKHTNGMRFSVFNEKGTTLATQVYYSIGGGFIVTEEEFGQELNPTKQPYPFESGADLLQISEAQQLQIADIMLANEKVWRDEATIKQQILKIAAVMQTCIEQGCKTTGYLPGFLQVKRRASELYKKLIVKGLPKPGQYADIMNWLNIFAMAVNEENAAGGRVVTAPTNGAAGIIPAVLQYYKSFIEGNNDEGVCQFLLTAAAIGILYKKRASISGAEVGCQGEVGAASSMAAGALAAVLGGTVKQVENAAEIAMEHHLGMTCDPVGGMVQIPCIERNAMGAVKAVNAARLALLEDGNHKVSLDKVIATMFQTGKDMMTIYKETSLGGLAVNVVEC